MILDLNEVDFLVLKMTKFFILKIESSFLTTVNSKNETITIINLYKFCKVFMLTRSSPRLVESKNLIFQLYKLITQK